MKPSFNYRILLISCGLLCWAFAATAQVLISVPWDKTIGGSANDEISEVIPTADGGYLLAGSSRSSASGDKLENSKGSCDENGICDYDYWLVKTDEEGNKLWDKTFGGNDDDILSGSISTPDGGFLLSGFSLSDASGDKSEDNRGGCDEFGNCTYDYWLVKTDEEGNKLWDKTFGGSSSEYFPKVVLDTNGGYLLAGFSYSDASGDKSEDSKGASDYWTIKIDESGNKIWDKTIGGSNDEQLSSAIHTPDGGFLLVGSILVKIDAEGNTEWEKPVGARSVTISPDGGYLLGSGPNYTVVKIDANGKKLWDKTYVGDIWDELSSIATTLDGGYLLSGSSSSDASGDKSEDSKGNMDYWIIKIDESGNKIWDKTVGGNFDDNLLSSIPTPDGGYLLSGSSSSDASGDKSENNQRGCDELLCYYDYWIVKVVETSFSINSLVLVNTETDEEIQAIQDGDTIDLATLSTTKLSIVANTEPEAIGSVFFDLTGPFVHKHTENNAPYALFGDNPKGDFSGRLLPPGAYTLTATPYAAGMKRGVKGTPLTISFTIIHSEEIVDSQVTGFALYDALTDEKIMELQQGSAVNLSELAHEEVTVLMHTVPDFVGSVKVELQGPVSYTRIENTKPYTLFRNNSNDLFGEVLTTGEYHLKATPFAEANAQGQAGEPLEISFYIVERAQVAVAWDKTYGGSSYDELTEVVSTSDGGYLLAGSSNSPASGDKSEGNKGDCDEYGYCSYDYWLVKTDVQGKKLWDKTIGGMGEDRLSDITLTADGGYLLLGSSLIKIDAQGNKLWEKQISASWITPGAQGGYLLAEDQDTTYWIAKIDEQGNREWEKTFADDRSDSIEGLGENPGQRITSITSSPDGGYLLAGIAFSIGGRFPEEFEYHADYWVVKLDAQGNKLWDMRYGSKHGDYIWRDDDLYTIIPDEDGGYLLAGVVLGGIVDYWIIKIDAQGNKLWDNTLGDGYEERTPVTVVPTGTGYLMAGSTPPETGNEEPSGDRGEASEGGSDYLIVMLDEQGNKLWDRTLGGRRGDVLQSAILTSDGSFLIAGSSNSPASGEKSEDNKGALDYWIVKVFEDEFFIQSIALLNAETDEELQELYDGAVIDLDTLSNTALSITANPEPAATGSVAFSLSGPVEHEQTDNDAPYALFGDQAGDFSGRILPPGEYTLIVTPYTEANGQGQAGMSLEVSFTIVDGADSNARLAGKDKKAEVKGDEALLEVEHQYLVYPVPFEDQLFIQSLEEMTALEVVLYDLQGRAYPVAVSAVAGGVQLNALAPLPAGVYLVRIFTNQQVVMSVKVQKQ